VTAPRSLAVGLINHPAQATDATRRLARVKLALAAHDKGYALVDTFEVNDQPERGEDLYKALECLAVHTNADAVFVAGTVDRQRVEDVAFRVRLLVQDADPWA